MANIADRFCHFTPFLYLVKNGYIPKASLQDLFPYLAANSLLRQTPRSNNQNSSLGYYVQSGFANSPYHRHPSLPPTPKGVIHFLCGDNFVSRCVPYLFWRLLGVTFLSPFVPKCSRIWAAEAIGLSVTHFSVVDLGSVGKDLILVRASLWGGGFTV